MLLLIDNYDSFTHNLVQAFGALGVSDLRIVRHDVATVEQLAALNPRYVVISPGPCTPREAGVSVAVVRRFAGRVPILGVCLGHQCIGAAFGMRIVRARRLVHGKTSWVRHDGAGVYAGLPNPVQVARYHSLALDESSIAPGFQVSARAEDGELMGIRHDFLGIEGVQFHPESFMTDGGPTMLANFLRCPLPTPRMPRAGADNQGKDAGERPSGKPVCPPGRHTQRGARRRRASRPARPAMQPGR